jgi:hypothetical protein
MRIQVIRRPSKAAAEVACPWLLDIPPADVKRP